MRALKYCKILVLFLFVLLLSMIQKCGCDSCDDCGGSGTSLSYEKAIASFVFEAVNNSGLSSDLICNISGIYITAEAPYGMNLSGLIASFTTTGISVTVNEVEQVSGETSNNFSSDIVYRVTAENGSVQDYTVTIAEESVDLEVIQVSVSGYHTVVLLNDGTVKCWGNNEFGQLGYGDTNNRGRGTGEMGTHLPTVDLGTGRKAVQIAAGQSHTAVLLDDGSVKCWGRNSWGQLGYGEYGVTTHRGDEPGEMGDNLPAVDLGAGRKTVQIAAGTDFTIALLDNGTVKCWGTNYYGMLGYGNTDRIGDEPGEMGDNLPAVDLGTGRKAVQVAAGHFHSIAILDDGSIKCWGRNNFGQLGYGDTDDRGDDPDEMGDDLDIVELGTGRTAVQVAAGFGHTVALLDNDTVKCWGYNVSGQLGYGDTDNRGDGIGGGMGDSLAAVNIGTGRKAVQIAAGSLHTLVLLDNDRIKCWGNNFNGQLGYGDTDDRGDGYGEMGNSLNAVNLGSARTGVQITAGGNDTAVLLDNGTVKCWGDNGYGQLGYGDSNDRGDDPGEMGDDLLPVVLWE